VELLEDRLAPAVFTVNTVADNTLVDSFTTLREAILAANAAPGADTINFNIPGDPTAVQTINPTSSLPFISGPVTIDGYTQGNAHPNTLAVGNDAVLLIEVNGTGVPATGGLRFGGGNNTVRGLVVNQFAGNGLSFFTSGENRLEGNFIGTDPTGAFDLGNGGSGVSISNVPNNIIGGAAPAMRNVIAGNSAHGISIFGASATGNILEGNYIGTNAAGTAAVPNGTTAGGMGIVIVDASSNRVGGTATGAGNVISGNGQNGVGIFGVVTGHIIQGNFIGTNATGTAAIPNGHAGVLLVNGAFENVVGGAASGARNVVSGNNGNGIQVAEGSTKNLVQGNYVGTNAAGTAAIGNRATGIGVVDSANNVIEGNLVSGNVHRGIGVTGQAVSGTTTGNIVRGNFIGTDWLGTSPIPNLGDGVTIGSSGLPGFNNTIGGPNATDRNVIAGNAGTGVNIINQSSGNVVQGNNIGADVNNDPLGNANWGVYILNNADNNSILDNLILANSRSGISVAPANSTGNTFAGNRIIGNGWVPIDLQIFSDTNQVTVNDLGDGDTGANNYQNFPFIAGVNTLGPDTYISGSLYSTPSTEFTLEFFAADALSPSGHRQAQYVLGTLNVTTDATGLATFVFEHTGSLPGPIVTATATNLTTGDTSEFFNPSPPTDIALSNQTLPENASAGALVGTFSTTDLDLGDAHTYSLVSGSGDDDNAAFTIIANELYADAVFDFESQSSYTIRVSTTDLWNLTFEKVFTISVTNVNDAPTLSGVPELATINEMVAYSFTASAEDPDAPAQTLTFSLLSAPAGAHIDPDTGEFTWTPTEAQGPASYTFTVRVSDGVVNTDAGVTLSVDEVNTAPTLDAIGDRSVDEGSELTFTATASDPDSPVNGLTFSLVNAPAGATIDSETGAFTWTPGDSGVYTVTVRVTDNGTPALSDEETITITVDNEAPVVSHVHSSADDCCDAAWESEWVRVRVKFADAGAANTHTAVINWGDGTNTTAHVREADGLGKAFGRHKYAGGGVYHITVTITDNHGAAVTTTMQAYVIGAGIVDGVLYVIGTECSDHVSINAYGCNQIKVHADFFPGCDNQRTFSAAGVQRIEVILCGGCDYAAVSDHIAINAVLQGGEGNDNLKGGGGDDILLGGDGCDLLLGGGGRDLLIGGRGSDRLIGNKDDDLLIAGATAFDANKDALFAVLAEWSSSYDYATRINNLMGNDTGPSFAERRNGNYFLKTDGPNATVLDDRAIDTLTGSAGRDLFFANEDPAYRDHVTDDSSAEEVFDIDP